MLAIISLCFLAAIGFLGYRLYMEHKFTLWSMSDQHRALLYGGVTVATGTLIASDRLFNSGLGTILWFALLGGSAFARLSRLDGVTPVPDLARLRRPSVNRVR